MNSLIINILFNNNNYAYTAEDRVYRINTMLIKSMLCIKTKIPNEVIFSNIYFPYISNEIINIDYQYLHNRMDIIREELIMKVLSPRRIQRYLNMGYSIQEIID